MLFFLDQPRTLLAIAIALLLGVVAHGVVQTLVAGALGDRLPRSLGRASPDPRRHLDAFGLVVMVIAVVGWGKPVPLTEPRFGGRGRYASAVLAGPATHLALAYAALACYVLSGGDLAAFALGRPVESFGHELFATIAIVNVLLGVLSLVPLPPLDGARLLWLFAPRTEGWRRARYYLEEQNYGLGIVFLLLLPLFSGEGLLYRIVWAVGRPVYRLMATSLGIET